MKYIYKTFIDLSKTDKLDYLSAWYVKYKVRRFLTSKNQVPLWIYRKLNAFKKDYYHLCKFVDDENALCEWDFQKKYFLFMNEKESLEYDNGKFTYNFCGRLVARYEKEVQSKSERVYNQICLKKKTHKDKMYKNPPQMKDYQLLSLVYDENFKYSYHKKIAYHLNLAIDRGLIDLPKLDLNLVSEEDLIELGFKYVF